ncbi:MFS transporter [Gordonia insulae]|uniref:Multidrug resistance protein Stp n=1 Tax=Gordonia insulae TaxID=2420509 RepID=A0A3G8JHC4_9ACTN|nr:MFS transporter [Gordonia insulae]AZG44497.1 Multidrug resistance protein Stp [Gordonia insulae]
MALSSPVPAAHPATGPVVAVAILASFVAFLDGSVVNLALPAISADLGGGLATQQWVVDAYLLALGALILVAGSISDAFGRLPVLRAGLLIFGLSSVVCAAAPTALVLIAGRGVQGVGAALLVPSSLALINSAFSPDDQPKAIGTWTAWTGTAFVVGPLLGGVLVDALNWRWIFAVNVIPVAVTVVLSMRLEEPPRTSEPTRIDLPGAILAAAGLAGTVYALIEQQRLGLSNPVVASALIGGVICLAGLFWRETHTDHPMIPLRMFAVRNFGVGNLATTFVYAGVSMGSLITVLFLQEVVGFSALVAGLATLPIPVLSFFIARPVGVLSARHGPRLFMAGGPIIAGLGYLLMLTTDSDFDFWWQMLPGLVLFGLGLSITVTPLTSAILAAVTREQSGIGSAINNAISRIAGLVAVACTGIIVGGVLDVASFHRAALITASLFIVGGIISAVGIRNRDHHDDRVPLESAAICCDRSTVPPDVRAPSGHH